MAFVALLSMYHVGQSSFLPRFSSFRPIHLSPRSGFGHYGNQESLKGPGSVRLTSLSLVVRNQLHRCMNFFFNFQNNLILTSKDKEVSGTDIFPCRLPPPLFRVPHGYTRSILLTIPCAWKAKCEAELIRTIPIRMLELEEPYGIGQRKIKRSSRYPGEARFRVALDNSLIFLFFDRVTDDLVKQHVAAED